MELPIAFVDKMKELLQEESEAFFHSYEKERFYGLRRNGLKCSKAEFEEKMPFSLSSIEWEENGYYYEPKQHPGRHPYHEAGVYYIQEPSAMSVAGLLEVQPGDRVCDLCAAPGGKSTQIASALMGKGLLVSNEFYPARARILSQNFERMGITNGVVLNEDTGHLAQVFPEFFDKIVVDAPCSGEGMFRKDELARGEWSPEQVLVCAKRQKEILENGAKMLRPGGILVYSTCTFSPEENEQVIGDFLLEHPDFSLVDTGKAAEGSGFSEGKREWLGNPEHYEGIPIERTLRIWPHKTDGEGHFLAKLQKKEGFVWNGHKTILPDKKCSLTEFEEFCQNTGINSPAGVYRMFGDELYVIPEEMIDIKGIKVERAGLHLGTMKKKRFEPSHGFALALKPEQTGRSVSLTVEEAVNYIHGETCCCDTDNGWILVTVEGFSLGWGKAVNGVVKNHYPKGLRR